MAQFKNMYKVELNNGIAPVVSLKQIYYADVEANRIGAIVTMNGQPFPLSGTCTGSAILADGSTVPMAGVIDRNQAYIDLDSSCYSVEGQIKIFVKVTTGGVTTTLLAAVGTVQLTETDTVIDPGTIIPSVSALITAIEDAVESIPADYTALLETIAPLYANLTFPVKAGQWCWYSGVLYEANQDISTSENWTAAHWETTTVGGAVSDLKSAFDNVLPTGQNLFDKSDCTIDGYYDGEGQLVGQGVFKSIAHPIDLTGISGKYLYSNTLAGAVDNLYFLFYRPNGEYRKVKINGYWSSPYITDGYDGSVVIAVKNEFVDSLVVLLSDTAPVANPDYSYYGRKLVPECLPYGFDRMVDEKIDDYILLHPVGGVNNGFAQVEATYGEELAGGEWTTDGWTAVTGGYQHTTGNTNPLTLDITSVESDKLYYVEFTATSLATNGRSEFSVTIGGSNAFETYKGGGASQLFKYIIKAGSVSEGLKITPYSTWTGTITGVSVKEITAHSVTPIIGIENDDETIVLQSRAGNGNSIYFGESAGKDAILDELNTGMGYEVLANLTSGFWNTAIGAYALQKVVNGTRNVAIGYTALKNLDSGDRNIAIGTFAQRENVTGRNNIAIGADALQLNTAGTNDIAIGTLAQNGNQGIDSVAVGHEAMHTGTNVNRSIAVGSEAMKNATGGQNVGIGYEALRDRTGGNNVAIGHLAGKFGTSGANNVFIGVNAGIRNNGSNNVIIGAQSIPSAIEDSSNKVIIGNADTDTVILGNKKLTFNQDGTVTWEALT